MQCFDTAKQYQEEHTVCETTAQSTSKGFLDGILRTVVQVNCKIAIKNLRVCVQTDETQVIQIITKLINSRSTTQLQYNHLENKI